jgi:hypothetical protein
MVTWPTRSGPVFAAIARVTIPLPLPGVGLVIVIHGAWLAADHAQPLEAETATVPVLAAAGAD